ncbi:DNA processing protein DprA [Polymorphobacter glacialis]|uniref:DNA processing protein DprA n=1 Tax=Sandarakinorhabdus glacialis TaxID=1614636 RepID=A0A916ZT50_9SPHN|nr:DNA-processing protein DprA [Polymorphobacter glacialis]GGE11440.1 DNA processing protein DprA [Polymorphobacter glacialis]
MPTDAVARLRLIRTDSIGPITYRQLMARFGDAETALRALPDLARRGGRGLVVASADAAEAELAALDAIGAVMIFIGTPAYPALLAGRESAPPVLSARGDVSLMERPAVAIVGARNASAAGVRFARALANDLAAEDLVVVSGLARGIDAAAHVGAMAGGTIAVVASGVDVVYPPENAALMAEIAEKGLLLAEQMPGTEPQARHFPRRNRIIAGLAAGTVVVEGAPKSGLLITARVAAEAGREVMAVPGSPLDPRAQGCNLLIREGATLVQSAADVVEALSAFGQGIGGGSQLGLRYKAAESAVWYDAAVADAGDAERAVVAALLSPTPVAIDEVVRLSGLAAAVVATVLLDLELGGGLVRHAGGRVAVG